MDDIIQEFLVESYESLDQLDSDFVALEESPDDRDRLASIFRTVHTIKGTSGFLAYPKLEKVAHVGENLLVPLRDGELELDHDIADALLAMVDAIRTILGNIETGGGEGETEFGDLIVRLGELKSGTAAQTPDSTASAETVAQSESGVSEAETSSSCEETPTVNDSVKSNDTLSAETGDTVVANTTGEAAGSAEPGAKVETSESLDSEVAAKKDESKPVAAVTPAQPAAKSTQKAARKKSSDKGQSLADSTVRINVKLLDKLMNQVGELVLARNQIVQFTSSVEDATMLAASQRLNLITTELQEGVMKTRMQPIRNAWSKLPRVVRDLSSSCGKKVEVVMEGAETELDKTILEAIKDPLTHIVRNSVDHGIESPDIRRAAGKSDTGTLLLRAFHESGQVNIEIRDDGGGINTDRIKSKAIEKELVTAQQVEAMSEHELTNLILLPGFSTAEQVTNVSGRGVGMDVVKTNIEKIGGSVDIQSVPGQGTTLRIKIPLTLAIVPALIVSTGGEHYAIPQVSLLELVRLDEGRAKNSIEFIHDSPVYRLRGNLLPLVYLDEQLQMRPKREWHETDENVNIVVLQAEDHQFGLVVDSINDTQEIVVKPLSNHLKNICVYAGATIMGDGSVALILDTIGVARESKVIAQNRERMMADRKQGAGSAASTTQSMLVVDPGDETRVAIQLSTVARLEEFPVSAIENSAVGSVVQYRDEILQLVPFSHACSIGHSEEGEQLQTVVYSNKEGQRIGIVVGRIVDIVQEKISEDELSTTGQAIIQERVTQIIDLEEWVQNNHAHLFHSHV